MRRVAMLASVCSGLLAARGQAQLPAPGTVTSAVQKAGPAVVMIRTLDAADRPLALGSGFIAPDGRVVTNAHVVSGAASAEVIGPDGQLLLTTQFAEALSVRFDVAVLSKISGSAHLVMAKLVPPVGEHIVVIGAPEGLSNTVSDGIVSASRQLEGRTLLQVTAPISHGSSGGPVLNLRAEVVGIATLMLRDGQNLNFAVPVSDINALLSSPPGHYPFPDRERSVAVASPSPAPPLPKLSPSQCAPIASADMADGGTDACAAVGRFILASKAMNAEALVAVWGTARGSVKKSMMKSEWQRRANIIMQCLSVDSFSVTGLTSAFDRSVTANVQVMRASRDATIAFRLVSSKNGAWFVENLAIDRLRDGGFCGVSSP